MPIWGQAVGVQANRAVKNATSIADRHVDGYLLILALRQVLRSASAMNKAVGGDGHLAAAVSTFLEGHPQAVKMRDVLTHFDEYEAGIGSLQETREVGDLTIWLAVGEDSVTVTLASELMLKLSTVSEAALALTEATLEAKDRFLERQRKARGN